MFTEISSGVSALDQPRRLERAGVRPGAGPRSARSARPRARLASLRVAGRPARPRRARRRGRRAAAALTVCSALTTVTPSGTISCACSAAEPCGTPSSRVALPDTAAASGTVASTRIWPAAERLLEVGQVLRLGAERHGQEHDRPARSRPRRSRAPSTCASGTCSRTRAAASSARPASREPITTGARPRRAAARGRSPARRCRR